ncbi:peroxisomal sarcosine oxidase-like [Pecten maximus]|uniref:peroxisomal sarcosine oxidase-like n=1 Tax=Pecten maximus TaxID=6579 RepID=UPI001457EF69|nr:peroxisomal sarcosine oxidase-like [Pecten maximus]XP_033747869.1 peroxisomal sarcosine oxidase-like [Pecten maximus]XP_033747870.1 peroxisomal sarcosine oxidase-like [Pecten maximus]XP_033747871.1 peroxisomal sarcosine oxidase-like [Pecten maximus]XP_033747872.1 peroxisomal sarcosine oxidase-like [Pecten maximus]
MDQVYDAIVVGAGIMGCSTAYNIIKTGQRALLLEQFPLPHTRGSSHGQSRIIRKAYGGEGDHYTKMMPEAFKKWAALEQETGTTLFKQTGILFCGSEGESFIKDVLKSLHKHSMPFTSLDSCALGKKYPMLRYPMDTVAVEDPSGGILFSDKSLAAFQKAFINHGGVLLDNEPMLDVYPGDIVTVKTNKGSYRGRNLVLTVGPWATKVLPSLGVHLPLKAVHVNVFYWKEKVRGTYSVGKCPVVIQEHGDRHDHFYGIPSFEYPGLYKFCCHHGPEIDPDRRDDVDTSWVLEKTKACVANNFPLLEPTPAIRETCIYTLAPDHNFILDRHPTMSNVIIGAGFSGHGFKLAPVVGKLLCELVMNKTPSYDMSPFRIDRFYKSSKL